jgi:hypothetical protein
MDELGARGRAIATENRVAWLVAPRVDLRRTLRSILRDVRARREWLMSVDVQV